MKFILLLLFLYVIYKFFVVPAMALNETYKREQAEKMNKTSPKDDDYIDYEEVDK